MINHDATLGQELLHLAVGQAVAGRYHRTAKMITTSGGNRNPANAEGAIDGATQPTALINQA